MTAWSRRSDEVSMFYDPMIAKLVTHAPTRLEAIDLQIGALDRYAIDGVGTNIDFLSALMQHDRFRSGEITTGFIAEEYPDGFHGAPERPETARAVAAIAAAVAQAGRGARACRRWSARRSDRGVGTLGGADRRRRSRRRARARQRHGRWREHDAGARLSRGRDDDRGGSRGRAGGAADRAQARADADHGRRSPADRPGHAPARRRVAPTYDRQGAPRHVALPGVADAGAADAP